MVKIENAEANRKSFVFLNPPPLSILVSVFVNTRRVCNYAPPPLTVENGKDGKAECLLKSSACLSGVSAQISESKRRFAPAGRARLLFSPIEETCVLLCLCVQIREELRANGIDVYPQKEFDEDAEDRLINDKIRVS